MADSVKEKRLALNDYKAARHSLARIIRMRFRGELESDVYRDMVYGLHCMLGFDKLQKETELEKRLNAIEQQRSGVLDTFDIDRKLRAALGIDENEPMDTAQYRSAREIRINQFLEKRGYIPKTEQALDAETGDQVERKSPTLGLFHGEPDTIPATEAESQPTQPRRLKL
jgi:hypothetical protein